MSNFPKGGGGGKIAGPLITMDKIVTLTFDSETIRTFRVCITVCILHYARKDCVKILLKFRKNVISSKTRDFSGNLYRTSSRLYTMLH